MEIAKYHHYYEVLNFSIINWDFILAYYNYNF